MFAVNDPTNFVLFISFPWYIWTNDEGPLHSLHPLTSPLDAFRSRLCYASLLVIQVTCRAIGIGAYLVRLGQRVIQVETSHIILTGASALNKVCWTVQLLHLWPHCISAVHGIFCLFSCKVVYYFFLSNFLLMLKGGCFFLSFWDLKILMKGEKWRSFIIRYLLFCPSASDFNVVKQQRPKRWGIN